MPSILFNQLPPGIQAVYRGVVKKTELAGARVRVREGRQGAEAYYVTLRGETDKYEYKNGCWTCTKIF